MTAELFVKLSAKLFAEQNQMDGKSAPTKVNYRNMNYSDEESSSSDSDDFGSGGGGASLVSPSLLSSANRFSALMDEGMEKKEKEKKKVAFMDGNQAEVDGQWIPNLEDKFWDRYRNQLRVNAVEGGVCDLNSVASGGGGRIKKTGTGRGEWGEWI